MLSFTNNRLACKPNRPRCRILAKYLSDIGFEWPEIVKEEEEEEPDTCADEVEEECIDEALEDAEEEECAECDEAVDVENGDGGKGSEHQQPAVGVVEVKPEGIPETPKQVTSSSLPEKAHVDNQGHTPSPKAVATPPPKRTTPPSMTPEALAVSLMHVSTTFPFSPP